MPKETKQSMTQEQLANMADRLTEAANSLRALIAAMRVQKYTSLDIKNHTTMVKGMKWIENYAHCAWEAHRDARTSQGDYGPTNGKG